MLTTLRKRGKIRRMRKPHVDYRVAADSLPEISHGLKDVTTRLERAGMQGPFKALNEGNTINALLCWWLAQPDDGQAMCIQEGLKILNRAIDSESPIEIRMSNPSHITPENAGPGVSATRNRKSESLDAPVGVGRGRKKNGPR